jgi:hypothetical protein
MTEEEWADLQGKTVSELQEPTQLDLFFKETEEKLKRIRETTRPEKDSKS